MQRSEVRVGVVGVGNCAKALIEGVQEFRDGCGSGAITPRVAGYFPGNVRFVAAFDVDARKVGQRLSVAMMAEPNCAVSLARRPRVLEPDPVVLMGPVLDGVGEALGAEGSQRRVLVSGKEPVDVAAELKTAGVEVLLCYLPVGSDAAAREYAGVALEAGCAFVNCIPSFIASDAAWAARFAEKKLPLIGDDIKSQFGATLLHRIILDAMGARGLELVDTYQLNVGGNSDFQNMTERRRLQSKKVSKTEAAESAYGREVKDRGRFVRDNVHVGPSDYVHQLADTKVCMIRVRATGFCGAPMVLEARLEVQDSPNSAGVVLDALRFAKGALDMGVGGPLKVVSAAYMKRPPEQKNDAEVWREVAEMAEGRRKIA